VDRRLKIYKKVYTKSFPKLLVSLCNNIVTIQPPHEGVAEDLGFRPSLFGVCGEAANSTAVCPRLERMNKPPEAAAYNHFLNSQPYKG
jgi:hypothetical protein